MEDEKHNITWEHRQAELWDRIFQVTQDVVTLGQTLESEGSAVVRDEMIKAATAVGIHMVRANAADQAEDFKHHLTEARLKAIETDYWLRISFVLQQDEEAQKDLSSILSQYTAIVDLLHKLSHHVAGEPGAVKKHTKGPLVS